MGNTTIIELNHDQAHEIEEHKELFLDQIRRQLSANEFEGKRIEGGRVVCFFHRHDSPIERAWTKFKKLYGGSQ